MPMTDLKAYGPAPVDPLAYGEGAPGWNGKRLVHFGLHNSANRNAGDTLLFPVVRRTFDVAFGPFAWDLRQLWQDFTPDAAREINGRFDGAVLGGGGLLLRDQAGAEASKSGWQWNSTPEAVAELRVPLSVFAIGYNRFRGQEDFDPVFTPHLRQTVRTAAFFGLRNHGSIAAVRDYLPDDLKDRPAHQYCPTTVLWQLYPQMRAAVEARGRPSRPVLAVNAAFDRAAMRFGDREDEQLASLARVMRKAQDRGWEIVQISHKTMDRGVEPALDAAGVDYRTVDLSDAAADQVMQFYAGVDLAVGMRGHAQMIPFGLRRPIISLISHNKMRYFLDDIGRNDWGLEVADPDFEARLDAMIRQVEDDPDRIAASLASAQEGVWQATRANMARIGRDVLGLPLRI